MEFAHLRGQIIERFGTLGKFAEAMNMTSPALSGRLNGKLSWKLSEIKKVCELLESTAEELFF